MRINELVHLNLYKMHVKIYYVIAMKNQLNNYWKIQPPYKEPDCTIAWPVTVGRHELHPLQKFLNERIKQ